MASNSDGAGQEVAMQVYDSTHYPSPPKIFKVVVSANDSAKNIKKKIAEQAGYEPEAFDMRIGRANITDDEDKTLDQLDIGPARQIHLSLRRGADSGELYSKQKRQALTGSGGAIGSSAIVPYGDASTTTTGNSSYGYTSTGGSYSSNYGGTYGSSNYGGYGSSGGYSSSGSNYGSGSYGSSGGYTSSYSSGYTSSYSSGYSGYGYSGTSSYGSGGGGWYSSASVGRSKTGFVGLSNQGATCYMNSLIQSLYMTPEFRRALYKWSFEEKYSHDKAHRAELERDKPAASEPNGAEPSAEEREKKEQEERAKKESDSIPLQLQRLFARLQLCDVQAVKTKALTRSFGWTDNEAFTQHDVQELCRVLFDALEHSFKQTEQANIVNDLYQGKMKDYVRCLTCNTESAREDNYLDVPLTLKGFGETQAVGSIEEAFSKFVQQETLSGDNQYSCEHCARKVDAVKGLQFVSFPYLLTLQLKRFDFDFTTMNRIKLNDRVTFPLVLDLNPFISGNKAPRQTSPAAATAEGSGESDDGDNKGKDKAESTTDPVLRTDERPVPTPELPYVYELFSILIHRGSSMGGHYYAYIKSFATDKWFEFNDSIVSEIGMDDIAKAFGGEEPLPSYARAYTGSSTYTSSYSSGYTSSYSSSYSSYRSSANAYMLMYRRVDSERNINSIPDDMIPEAVRQLLDEEQQQAKKKRETEEAERDQAKLRIFYQGAEKSLNVDKATTLAEATQKAVELFGIGQAFEPENVRLRGYQYYNQVPAETYTGQEQKSLAELGLHSMYSAKTLLLETKEHGQQFAEYNPTEMFLRIARYLPASKGFDQAVSVYVHKDATLGDLRQVIAQKLGVPPQRQRLLKETGSYRAAPVEVLAGDPRSLRMNFYLYESAKLYLEESEDVETLQGSEAAGEIERLKNQYEVRFNLPGKTEADQKLVVANTLTIKQLKALMQPIVGVEVDDFKLYRGAYSTVYKTELKNEDEPLSQHMLNDAVLTVEKGKPLKAGEYPVNFHLFDPSNEENGFTELFELVVQETVLVNDLKATLARKLKDDKNIEMDPNHMRLREMFTRTPSKVYPNDKTLKDCAKTLWNGKSFAIQSLGTALEPVTSDRNLVPFVQQWHPASFEAGPKEEMVLTEDMTMDAFKALLAEKHNIDVANIGIAKASGASFQGIDLLEIPDLQWDRPMPAYATYQAGTLASAPLYLRDGDLVLFRDNAEKLKELTKEEREKMEKDANSKKRGGYSYVYSRKEKALKIHTSQDDNL